MRTRSVLRQFSKTRSVVATVLNRMPTGESYSEAIVVGIDNYSDGDIWINHEGVEIRIPQDCIGDFVFAIKAARRRLAEITD